MKRKIIRVDMSTLTSAVEDVPPAWTLLGGRALTSTVVAEEVPPECHPLGEHNKLIFAPGLLTGTHVANSGRLSAGAKSPLTGGIKESNSGGTAAMILAHMGIRAIIIQGMPAQDRLHGLHVTREGVSFREADALAGQGNFQVLETLAQDGGKKDGVLTIGPAGEMKMCGANISVKDPDGRLRSLGRGGLGAVMGAKKIKYISLEAGDKEDIPLADHDAFKAASKTFLNALREHPVSSQGLPTYGTNVLINVLHEAGGLPTKNFRSGQFPAHDRISGETRYDLIQERGGKHKKSCHPGCIIQCSQVYPDKEGNPVTAGFEYETIWAFGANCCIEDLDRIAEADHIMDDIGVDSIEMGVTLGVAMEAGILPFGDGPGTVRLLREIGEGTPLGRILGNGAVCTGKAYGVTRVPAVKGQGIPAYDPRAVKGIGITYCTTPMGADHTAGYSVATNIMKVGGFVDPLGKEGQVELSRKLQIATALLDSLGLCLFVAFPVLDIPEAWTAIVDLVDAMTGSPVSGDDLTELGKDTLLRERAFNLAAGFTRQDDRLPEFFREPVPPHNTVWDFTDEEIDAFWNFQ